MPGTIQVSGLMDSPKAEVGNSCFSLKVAMGRREYQSMGHGDCSIPLVSIRENLIVVIEDVEGNEIFKSEFRTMSVVEKGLLEDSFPLKSDGFVRMKLQFSLSQEELMRIREMRESAQKRKRREQLETETKASVSDPSGSSRHEPLQASEQPSERSFENDLVQHIEAHQEKTLNSEPPLEVPNKFQISSEAGLDRKMSVNAAEHSCCNSAQPKEKQNRRDVKKMVTAFENNLFQAPDHHFDPRIKSSLLKVEANSEESCKNKIKVPRKSFSSGMLSDLVSQPNPKSSRSIFLKKKEEIENVGSGQRLEFTNEHKLKSQNSLELISAKESTLVTKTVISDRFNAPVKERGDHGSIEFNKVSAFSLKRDFKEAEGTTKGNGILNRDSITLSLSGEGPKTSDSRGDGNRIIEHSATDHLQLLENVKIETLHTEETHVSRKVITDSVNIGEPSSLSNATPIETAEFLRYDVNDAAMTKDREFPDMSTVSKTADSISNNVKIERVKETRVTGKDLGRSERKDSFRDLSTCITKENESECFGSRSVSEFIAATPNDAVEVVTYFDNDGCPCGNHDVWSNRRPCITTGSRQLRDLVGCCTKCGEINPIEENSSIEYSDQDTMPEDESIEVNKNGKSCSSAKPNRESSVGISKSNGGLIEQGVRIAVILVAGALIFNTRQHKQK